MARGAARWIAAAVLAVAFGLWVAGPCSADLWEYVARPEPEYKWEKASVKDIPGGTVTTLKMRSQVWHEIPWDHSIEVFRPAQVAYPNTMLLFITGGNPGGETSGLGAVLAGQIGAPVAVLWNIPNQPLFNGLTEDALIAYTFTEFQKSGDETWPALFPMAKSAVKAMDTLQAFASQEWNQKVTDFVVTGASKRGWTTWLTGTVDKRVIGIMPMVIDTLNMPKQMPHQIETWGSYSMEIGDYTARGLQEQMAGEKGRTLVGMVDPYSYRKHLTMPKMIINGANDPYWVTDALNLYWDGLRGSKWVLYAPNSGHGLNDRTRVVNTMIAFYHYAAGDQPFPKMSWAYENASKQLRLRIASDIKPTAARLWIARSDNLDFRPSKWEAVPMKAAGDGFVGEVAPPTKGGLAVFGEAEYNIEGRTFTLSTQVRMMKAK